MARALLATVAGLFIAGCAAAPQMALREQRLGALDTIAEKCGVPRSMFNLIGDDHLQIKPDTNMTYEKVDCALKGVQKSGIPFKMGFVGNELYAPELK